MRRGLSASASGVLAETACRASPSDRPNASRRMEVVMRKAVMLLATRGTVGYRLAASLRRVSAQMTEVRGGACEGLSSRDAKAEKVMPAL